MPTPCPPHTLPTPALHPHPALPTPALHPHPALPTHCPLPATTALSLPPCSTTGPNLVSPLAQPQTAPAPGQGALTGPGESMEFSLSRDSPARTGSVSQGQGSGKARIQEHQAQGNPGSEAGDATDTNWAGTCPVQSIRRLRTIRSACGAKGLEVSHRPRLAGPAVTHAHATSGSTPERIHGEGPQKHKAGDSQHNKASLPTANSATLRPGAHGTSGTLW